MRLSVVSCCSMPHEDAGPDERDQVAVLHLLVDEPAERLARGLHVLPRDAEVVDDQHHGALNLAAW